MIHITDHARERFKERWKKGGSIQEIGDQAFKEGKFLPSSLKKTVTLLGFHNDGYWTAHHRVFKKFVFVYQKNGNDYVLTTIFPLFYLIQQRNEMVKRYQRSRHHNFK